MAVDQISVFLENKPGQLAQITRVLADSKIDLRALSIAETEDYGVLRILTDKPSFTVKVLKENGYVCATTPVVAVGVPDVPGGLCGVLELIAKENVDIEYMYSLFCVAHEQAVMVFQTKEPGALTDVFRKGGLIVMTGKDIGINE